MKFAAFFVALVLPSLSSLARAAMTIDDPPPEPVDCPLCGGNAGLHVARTFAILDAGGDLAAHVLRW